MIRSWADAVLDHSPATLPLVAYVLGNPAVAAYAAVGLTALMLIAGLIMLTTRGTP